jgi:hypothetical protein
VKRTLTFTHPLSKHDDSIMNSTNQKTLYPVYRLSKSGSYPQLQQKLIQFFKNKYEFKRIVVQFDFNSYRIKK